MDDPRSRPAADVPILVTGSPRSGTSIFTYALRKGARIAGYNEGHVLDLLPSLALAAERFYARPGKLDGSEARAITHLPLDRVLAELTDTLFGMMDRLHGGARWVDKTPGPGMLDVLRVAHRAGRAFRVAFLHRRAIETVRSRVRKFPGQGPRAHAEAWVQTMTRWREVRTTLPAEWWIEIDQHDIATRPDGVALACATIFELSPEQRDGMAAMLRNERRQQLASEKVDETVTLDALDWTDAEKTMFQEIVAEEMVAWGYRWDEAYRDPPSNVGRAEA